MYEIGFKGDYWGCMSLFCLFRMGDSEIHHVARGLKIASGGETRHVLPLRYLVNKDRMQRKRKREMFYVLSFYVALYNTTSLNVAWQTRGDNPTFLFLFNNTFFSSSDVFKGVYFIPNYQKS